MRRILGLCLLAAATAGCGLTVPLNENLAAQSGGDSSVGGPSVAGTAGTAASGDASAGGSAAAGTGATAADGSTGTTGGTAASGTTGATGSGTTGATGTSGSTGTSGTTGTTGSTGSTGRTSTGGTTTAASGKAVASAAPTKAGATTAAVTTPIKVGVVTVSGVQGLATALGIKGLSTGDTQAQAQALVDDLNKNGGINGRKVTPIFVSDNASADQTTEQQSLCATLTQDNHVDAVMSFVNSQQLLATCLKQAGVVYLGDSSAFGASTAASEGNYWFGPADITLDRLAKNEADALAATGWMTKANKVGIFAYNDADAEAAVNNTMVPELARLGIPVVQKSFVARDTSGVSAAGSAALSFRGAGVDRVLTLNASPLFFMNAAQNQGYTPKYAINSGLGPGALLESAAPKAQLEGSAGFGWQPFSDIGAGTRPANYSSNETRCQSIMTNAGQGSSDAGVELFESEECDMFFFLHDAGVKGGGVKAAQLGVGAAALGNWPSASSFGSAFPGSRSDGVATYRVFSFTDSCSCFQYSTGVQSAT